MPTFSKLINRVEQKYKQYRAEAPERERKALERAKNDTERDRVRSQMQMERLQAKEQVLKAKTATKKAQIAYNKAKKEAGGNFNLSSLRTSVMGTRKRTKRTNKKSSW